MYELCSWELRSWELRSCNCLGQSAERGGVLEVACLVLVIDKGVNALAD